MNITTDQIDLNVVWAYNNLGWCGRFVSFYVLFPSLCPCFSLHMCARVRRHTRAFSHLRLLYPLTLSHLSRCPAVFFCGVPRSLMLSQYRCRGSWASGRDNALITEWWTAGKLFFLSSPLPLPLPNAMTAHCKHSQEAQERIGIHLYFNEHFAWIE